MDQYIKVKNKVISAEELCKLLGVDPQNGTVISIGHTANGGAFEVSTCLGSSKNCAFMDVQFCPDGEDPILLAHVELDGYDVGEGEEVPVRTFLYDRAENYVAYMDHNICPEEDLGDIVLRSKLIASGDMDVIVDVYRENQFVAWHGPLPTQD